MLRGLDEGVKIASWRKIDMRSLGGSGKRLVGGGGGGGGERDFISLFAPRNVS